MPSISHLQSEARKIGLASNDPIVARLAEIVAQLCSVCSDLEKKTKEAHDDAKRAKRAARQ